MLMDLTWNKENCSLPIDLIYTCRVFTQATFFLVGNLCQKVVSNSLALTLGCRYMPCRCCIPQVQQAGKARCRHVGPHVSHISSTGRPS